MAGSKDTLAGEEKPLGSGLLASGFACEAILQSFQIIPPQHSSCLSLHTSWLPIPGTCRPALPREHAAALTLSTRGPLALPLPQHHGGVASCGKASWMSGPKALGPWHQHNPLQMEAGTGQPTPGRGLMGRARAGFCLSQPGGAERPGSAPGSPEQEVGNGTATVTEPGTRS